MAGSGAMGGTGAMGGAGAAAGAAGSSAGGSGGSAGSSGAAGSGGSAGAAGTGGTGPTLFCGDGLVDLTKEQCDGDAEGRAGETVTCDTNCNLKSWCNITPAASAGAPGIGCIFPPAGRASGGTYATISGVGFDSSTTVTIGGAAATMIFRSATEITFFAPAGTANSWADVVVQNSSGQTATRTAAFAFHPDANVAMNANDAGPDSLRVKISAAASGDFVTLDRFVAGQTIHLASQIGIGKSLTLVGLGAGRTVLDGGGTSAVFYLGSGTNELYGVTVTNGAGVNGGGIRAAGTRLTLTECAVVGNSTVGEGGGIYLDAAGYLVLRRSTVSGNTGGAGGGIRLVANTVPPTATIINSTISGNVGDGIFSDIPLTVQSSTIVDNTAAGIVARLNSCTISGSIVARNATDVTGGAGFVSQGYNLIGVAPVGGPWGSTDKTGTSGAPLDPLVSALALNFGLTETHRLLTGSPAIDGGDPTSTLSEDQARMPRPSGGVVDIGAVELQQ